MYALLIALRTIRKTRKVVAEVIEEIIPEASSFDLDSMVTQAAGYGFEIGRGQPLRAILHTSIDNPFTNPNWREKVQYDG